MGEVQAVSSTALGDAGLAELRGLLDAAFDGDFGEDDFAHCLGGVHLVMRADGLLVAHAAVVPRRLYVGDAVLRCGYVEAVASRPGHRRRGLGARVMAAAGDVIGAAYEVGALSTGVPAFYERLGWRRWRGPAYVVRADGGWERTPDEDDGVMVLGRPGSGPSVAVDERPGDAW